MSNKENSPKQDPMEALRNILFAGENKKINEIVHKFEDENILSQDVASVLAEAIRLRNKQDNQLGKALAPTIEESIKASIAKDPQPLSDSLFPVMGPAIRKSINNAIEEMMQSMTQTMDNSFTVQGLKWRWDAMRTGKSFSEVVMLNTLVYRVEQVFLIHKETGLLLHHLSFDPALNEDADVVSSMLTAVRDFVQDSFGSSGSQQVDNLSMGDLEILIEPGSDVVLALVCRGNPPRSLRTSMQDAVGDIQKHYYEELNNFEGDTSSFDDTDDELKPLMISDFAGKKGGSPLKAIIILLLIIFGLLGWAGWSIYQNKASASAWDDYIQALQQEPGIVVASAINEGGQKVITGLRDPFSQDPYTLSHSFAFDASNVEYNFEPYYALAPEIVLNRVRQKASFPEQVSLSLKDSTLYLSGVVKDLSWLEKAHHAALLVHGVDVVDSSAVSLAQAKPKPAPKPIEINMPRLKVVPVQPKPKPKPKPKPVVKEKPVLPLSDEEILRREVTLLNPPETVTMTFAKGILHVSGSSSREWIDFATSNFMKVRGANSLYTQNFTIEPK